MSSELTSEPPTYNLLRDLLTEIPSFIKELGIIQFRVQNDMTWTEARNMDLKKIKENISYYKGVVNESLLPSKMQEKYIQIYKTLNDLERKFQVDKFLGVILQREFERFANTHNDIFIQYQKEGDVFTLDSITPVIRATEILEAELNESKCS